MRTVIFFLSFFILTSCKEKSSTYTLYRNSPLDENMRIHVATFDADEGDEGYNRTNCEDSAKMRKAQHGVVTNFWCEKGRFKK